MKSIILKRQLIGTHEGQAEFIFPWSASTHTYEHIKACVLLQLKILSDMAQSRENFIGPQKKGNTK